MHNGNSGALAGEAVVLFVDAQRGIAEGACTADTKTVDENASKLAQAVQLYGMPIVLSVVGIRGEPELTARLAEALGDSAPMHQRTPATAKANAANAPPFCA